MIILCTILVAYGDESADGLVSDTKGGCTMCLSCGCGSPNDDHGDSRNITLNDLDQAAQAAGTSVGQVAQNISSSWSQMAGASGERGLPGSSQQQGQQGSASQNVGQQTDTSTWQQQNQTQPQRQPGQY